MRWAIGSFYAFDIGWCGFRAGAGVPASTRRKVSSACHCDRGWICEAHSDLCWSHGDCAGPGMPCDAPACPWWADAPPSATMFDQSYVWPPEPLAARKPFHERAWRLVGPSNRVLVCEIVGVPTGFEVHAYLLPAP